MTEQTARSHDSYEAEPPNEAVSVRVTNIFVPVQNVQRARVWYRDVLGLPVGEVVAGHLCVIEMPEGPSIILDQKLRPDGPVELSERGAYPLFMLGTPDIEAALATMRERSVEVVAYDGKKIQNGHWFNFRDLDGNLLMMCS